MYIYVFIAPFQPPPSNPKCTRICRNGGICLVKIDSINKNNYLLFLFRLMNPIKNNAYVNHLLQVSIVN